jgi:hypothetical protein
VAPPPRSARCHLAPGGRHLSLGQDGVPLARSRHATEPESALTGYLDDARRLFAARAEAGARFDDDGATRCAAGCDLPPTEDFEALRWFPLPDEIRAELAGGELPARARGLRPE